MKYRLIFSARARRDYYCILAWLLENRSEHVAANWNVEFQKKLVRIKESPESFPLFSENNKLSRPTRECHFGISKHQVYRVIFSVKGESVNLHRIRHHSQDDLHESDI